MAEAVFFGMLVAGGLYVWWRMRREPWLLRVTDSGLTVRGHPEVPWRDVRELRLRPTRFGIPFVRSTKPPRATFVGVENPLPGLTVAGLPARMSGLRDVVGEPELVLLPGILTIDQRGLIDLAQRHGVAVVREPRP